MIRCGTVLNELGQCNLNLLLRVGIHGGRRLVQDQNLRVAGQCPRKREELALAARDRLSPFVQNGCVTIRHGLDEVRGQHAVGGLFHGLIGDAAVPEPDVVSDTSTEKEYVLENDGNALPQLCWVPETKVDSVDCDVALVHIIEAVEGD